jgi:hypothetical protein
MMQRKFEQINRAFSSSIGKYPGTDAKWSAAVPYFVMNTPFSIE